MSVHPKHIATFLLGAAAGLAAAKYMSMTPEEKEKLADAEKRMNDLFGKKEKTAPNS